VSATDAYDVICIGGGTAGMSAARAAAFHGGRVALVERAPRLGGDCTFTGCIPSKTLIHHAGVWWKARSAAHFGIDGSAMQLDFARLMTHVAETVEEVARDERDEVFLDQGIDVLHGHARILAPGVVEVDGRRLVTTATVLATGSRPAVLGIPGLAAAQPLTNESVFTLRRQPERLVILGGGPVGVELGQAFQRLGTAVTLFSASSRLLPREEPEASACVREALVREGMTVHLSARADRVERRADGWRVHASERSGDGDRILVATGRAPRLEALGLDHLGIATDRPIAVDERCRTSVENIYAAGDCVSPYRFTHVAAHDGRAAGANAAGKRAKVNHDAIPWVTFSDPEVARVGLTEETARARFGAVESVTFPMSRVDRARTAGETDGFIKVIVASRGLLGGPIVHATGGRVVGAQIVGMHAGEVLGEVTLAMHVGMFAGRIAQTMHAYPTISLGLQQAVAQLFAAGRAQIDGN
jgi:pyruvate/2-oxoglutarate dehydrogenase complex dihydrolipoamide dehydrogenase (E3) component